MKKVIGATCLVAGTAIGAGMIALPMMLAKLGLALSVALMITTWLVMYYSALVSLELNITAGRGMPLGALATRYGNKLWGWVGAASLIALSYALLSAYIYAGSQVIQKLLLTLSSTEYAFDRIAAIYGLGLGLILALGIGWIDYVNRLLFIAMLVIVMLLIVALGLRIDVSNLPVMTYRSFDGNAWSMAMPVAFTSFGFQVIFHTLTNYCNNNPVTLKRAFFWGSFIPLVVYIIWTVCTLGALNTTHPHVCEQLVSGNLEVGDFMVALSQSTYFPHLELLAWGVSILAIVTSAIGVGLGLIDTLKDRLTLFKGLPQHLVAVVLTVLPPLVIALHVPNAFIQALSFAGLVLVIIAIIIPLYLHHRLPQPGSVYPLLTRGWIKIVVLGFGILIMLCELRDLWG